MTVKDFYNECIMYPYSKNYYDLCKECAELDLMRIYAESMNFIHNNNELISECNFNESFFGFNEIDHSEFESLYTEKVGNIFSTIKSIIIKLFKTISTIFKNIKARLNHFKYMNHLLNHPEIIPEAENMSKEIQDELGIKLTVGNGSDSSLYSEASINKDGIKAEYDDSKYVALDKKDMDKMPREELFKKFENSVVLAIFKGEDVEFGRRGGRGTGGSKQRLSIKRIMRNIEVSYDLMTKREYHDAKSKINELIHGIDNDIIVIPSKNAFEKMGEIIDKTTKSIANIEVSKENFPELGNQGAVAEFTKSVSELSSKLIDILSVYSKYINRLIVEIQKIVQEQ